MHINWPASHCREFVSSCCCEAVDRLRVDNVIEEASSLPPSSVVVVVVVNGALVVCAGPIFVVGGAFDVRVIGDLDHGTSEEPVKDWPFFTQNISQNSQLIYAFTTIFCVWWLVECSGWRREIHLLCIRIELVLLIKNISAPTLPPLLYSPQSASSEWSGQWGCPSHFWAFV